MNATNDVMKWTVFNLMVDTIILAEMREAESDIYTTLDMVIPTGAL